MSSLTEKLFTKEKAFYSAGIVTIFTLLQRIIQVGRGIIFARLLGPTEYGTYTLAFFFFPLISLFARMGVTSCFTRYIPYYESKGMLKDFIKKTYGLTMIGGVGFTVASLFFSSVLSQLIYGDKKYVEIMILCILSIIPYIIYENLFYSFNGLRVFKLKPKLH